MSKTLISAMITFSLLLLHIPQKVSQTLAAARKVYFVRITCLFAGFTCLFISVIGLQIGDVDRAEFIRVQIVLFTCANALLIAMVWISSKAKYPLFYIFHTALTLYMYLHAAALSEAYAQYYTVIAMLELFLGAALLPAFPKVVLICSVLYWLGIAGIRSWVLPAEYDLEMSWSIAKAITFVSIGSSILYHGLFSNLTNLVRVLRSRIDDLNELTSLLNITLSQSEFGLIGFETDGEKRFERGPSIARLNDREDAAPIETFADFERMAQQELGIDTNALFDAIQEVIINDHHFVLKAYRLQDMIVISHMDVTEMRAVENKLRQNQKLSLIGEITSGVAHNYNNALAIALSRLEAINPEDNTEFWNEYIGPSIRAIQTSSEVSQKLLAFSGQQQLRVEHFDVSETIHSMSGLIESALGSSIVFEIHTPLTAFISTDKNEFESAILNLVINAKNAITHDAGKVVISTARVGDFVQICVQDNGSGVEPKIIKKIFDPFFTTNPHKFSSGLGLPTVKGFVEQSNGYVTLESEPGKTMFFLHFPLSEEQLSASPLPAGPPVAEYMSKQTGLENILIVDDTVEVALSYSKLLTAMGYAVRYETSPLKALKTAIEDQSLTKIIIDFSMPEMNGVILGQKIKAQRPDLKLFMLTGDVGTYRRDGLSVKCFEEVLIKPIHAKALKKIIEKYPNTHALAATQNA